MHDIRKPVTGGCILIPPCFSTGLQQLHWAFTLIHNTAAWLSREHCAPRVLPGCSRSTRPTATRRLANGKWCAAEVCVVSAVVNIMDSKSMFSIRQLYYIMTPTRVLASDPSPANPRAQLLLEAPFQWSEDSSLTGRGLTCRGELWGVVELSFEFGRTTRPSWTSSWPWRTRTRLRLAALLGLPGF